MIGAQALRFDGTPENIVEAGLDLRGAIAPGKLPLGFAIGAGYHFGASIPGGFAYEVALLPLGVSFFVDDIGWLAVVGGGDLSGVTTRVPFAPRTLVEARIELQLPGPFHFAAFARPAWLAVDARQDGSNSIGFADELEAGAGFRIGSERERWDIDSSRGVFVGGLVRQWLGQTGFGLVVAYTVDGQFGGR